MLKGVASKFRVFAFDSATGLPKTGDAAQITGYYSKDKGAVTAITDTSATEESAANAAGWYLFDATTAETNADDINVTGKSSTSGIVVVGENIRTIDLARWSVILEGTASACTTAAITLQAGQLAGANTLTMGMVKGTSAGNFWQPFNVYTNTAADPIVATFADAIGIAPTGTITYVIYGAPAASTAHPANVSIGGVLGTALTEGAAGRLAAALTAFLNVPTPVFTAASVNMPALVGGRVSASVGAMEANTFTASAVATDAVTELQSGLATTDDINALDTDITNLDNYVDTEMAAVLAKVNFLPSITAGAAGGLLIAGANAPISFSGAGITATLTGNLTGSVATLTGFTPADIATIMAKVANLPADPADASDIAALIAAVNVLNAFQKAFLVNWEITNVTTTSANLRVWPVGTAHVSGTGELAIIPLVRADATSAWTKATL